MSEARLYYNHVVDSLPNKHDRDAIRKYVDELEQQKAEIFAIKLFTEARDKYHNFFMSRDRVRMMEQIEHDEIMKHYNFAIEFLQSYKEAEL